MKLSKFTAAILAVAGIVLATSAAQAANVGTYSDQDVLVGFNSSSVSNSLLLDVGQISSLLTAAQSGTVSLGNINTDLTSNFGPSYFGTSVLWGAAASDTSSDEVWASRAVGQPAWHSSFAQGAAYNNISATGGTYTNSVVYGADSRITAQPNSTVNTWGYSQPGGGYTTSFNYFNPTIEGGTNQGLDFYYLPEGSAAAGTLLGIFSLGSNGDLTFGLAPVPEPATYVAGAMAVLGVILLRRKMVRHQS